MRASLALALTALLAAAPALSAEHRHARPAVLAPGYADLSYDAPVPGSYELPPLWQAADAQLLDSAGKEVALHELYGDKLVVLSFIYTRCSDVNGCPLATHVLGRLQRKLLAEADLKDRLRLISVSFDPDYDTPQMMRAYADNFRAPGSDWRFLTARSESELAPLLEAYDQWVIKDYDADGNYLGTMSHLLRVYLIDRERRVRNIYSVSFLHAETVAADIRTLLLGAAG